MGDGDRDQLVNIETFLSKQSEGESGNERTIGSPGFD